MKGNVTGEDIQKFLINNTGTVRAGASNCAFAARIVSGSDPVWFIMNNERHPWNCNGIRSQILVNFAGASSIFAQRLGGGKFVIGATFKNWSHTNTFPAEISTSTFNWPSTFCKNEPSTNTAASAKF
jgi:hypothetical protein